ncbi:MAG TPA: methyltransferase [Smithellaceae bacterium]|nr:methyltransferase [Smithellaceae bacterium]
MNIHNGEQLLEMMRSFHIPCILAAAADLDLFETMASAPKTAADVAAISNCDLRGVTILLDALTAIGLIIKKDDHYSLSPELEPYLREGSPQNVMAMIRHQANCLRRWSWLPWTIKTGKLGDPGPSILGEDADNASFIEAMNVVSRGVADRLIREINPGNVRCILDLGGASGTWAMAWLKAEPEVRAIIFDLPQVISMTRERFSSSPFANRVELRAGDFYTDELPRGADLAWVSAIIHQNSPKQNLALYRRVAAALKPNGWIYIRDIVMEPSRTAPVVGALFAVNMLAGTEGGNCYTLSEIEQDLLETGFHEVELVHRDEGMHSVVRARVK